MTSSSGVVGVVGGYGAVGLAALRQLRAWGVGPLRVGGRNPARAARAAADLGAGAVAVDATDDASLAAFCAGCSIVVNCAGPAVVIGDRVARTAVAAGASYVDAAGDDALHALLAPLAAAGRPLVISAGLMPGLTGLLPRYLVRRAGAAGALTAYVGGRDRFTVTAAVDYLAVAAGYGEPLAVWRDGRVVPRGLAPLADIRPPAFLEPVIAQPYLSTETERLARALRLPEVRWYSVFAGPRLIAALRQAGGADARKPAAVIEAARRISDAAELDVFGHRPYQQIVLELSGERPATLVLRGSGASALTGTAAALAVYAVREGRVPPGVHHAAEVLDPADSVALLRTADAVEEFVDGTVDAYEFQEGVL
ncbi:MAG TPA: saccharopine dehydrogenase NADP-binding domain-containing protein [Pilimelia sp.]|nr:saccharopine dehydrogenase NADP-binding domain-containing protein [Pilimelia sp.]